SVARGVDAPEPAADQAVQPGDADPDRPLAILGGHPAPRSGQSLLGAEHAPLALIAVEQTRVGGNPEDALLVEREIAAVARARQTLRVVLESVGAFRQRPEVTRRAGPDHSFGVTHHRVDALAPRVEAAPLSAALQEESRSLRRRHHAAPVRPHRGGAARGPTRGRNEASPLLDQELGAGGYPERSSGRGGQGGDLDGRSRQRMEAPVAEAGHAAKGAHREPAVAGDRKRSDLVGGQSVFGAEAVEAVAVVPVEAVLGGHPEVTLSVL